MKQECGKISMICPFHELLTRIIKIWGRGGNIYIYIYEFHIYNIYIL